MKTRRTQPASTVIIRFNANYRELVVFYRAEQRRQIGVREGGRLVPRVGREPPRQAINDDMIDISKYFPRDGPPAHSTGPLRYFAIVFATGYRQRHLFKCNISPPNEDYLAGKCVPQVHRPSSSTLPFVPLPSSRCHADEGPFVYPPPLCPFLYMRICMRDINKKFYVRYLCKNAI